MQINIIEFTKLYTRIFRPGLSACLPNHPLPTTLVEALNTVTAEIEALLDGALMQSASA